MAANYRRKNEGSLVNCVVPDLPDFSRDGIYVCKVSHSHQDIAECQLNVWVYAGPEPVPGHAAIVLAIQNEVPEP